MIELLKLPDPRFTPRHGFTHVLIAEKDGVTCTVPFDHEPTPMELCAALLAIGEAADRAGL